MATAKTLKDFKKENLPRKKKLGRGPTVKQHRFLFCVFQFVKSTLLRLWKDPFENDGIREMTIIT